MDEAVDEDEARGVLAAYLPVDEPAETPLADLVARARTVRRRRRAVLASAVSVIAVLAASAVAVALTGVGAGRAPMPAPPASRPVVPSTPATSPGLVPVPCDQANRSNDPGARAWATWVRGKLGPQAKAGPAGWLRMCELDMGYT